MQTTQWIDITTAIENGMVHWPGDVSVQISKSSNMDAGDAANVTDISMSAHTATHIDAPKHFIKDGKDITQIPIDVLIGDAKVFQIQNPVSITLDEIKNFSILKGDRVLFKTINSTIDWAMKDFRHDYVYLATDAAKFLLDKGVICVGIDYLSIAGEANGAEVHQFLLANEIVIIEGLNLKDIDEGEYEMICLPIKIKGADGAPARVIIKKKIK